MIPGHRTQLNDFKLGSLPIELCLINLIPSDKTVLGYPLFNLYSKAGEIFIETQIGITCFFLF